MKRIIFFLFTVLGTISMFGQTVSVAEAMAKAVELASEVKHSQAKEITPSGNVSTLTLAYTSQEGDRPHFYVFNYPQGGFAIIGGDESAKEILGYSEYGEFNIDSIPDGLKFMLDYYDEQIGNAISAGGVSTAKMNTTDAQVTSTTKTSISPLLSTQWNQTSPYNSAIPLLSSGYSSFVTGCAATAAAQIMKYYNYPSKGISSHSYNVTYTNYSKTLTFSADFANTTYDWSNMLDSYTGSYTTTQKNAVATLMYHVGVAMNTTYGWSSSGSSVYSSNVLPALVNYFGYNTNAKRLSRSSYSDTDWESLVYDELYAGRPLFYEGQSSSGGHGFVCDGYSSSSGNYHFNWGWDGYCDGYYPLTGTSALKTTAGTYSESQSAIFGLQPSSSSSIPVTGITLSSTSVQLSVGGTKTLTATVTPSTASNSTVSWSSSNTSVATVGSSGLITAKAAGTATITCKAADGSGIIASCIVSVTDDLAARKSVVASNNAGATVSFSTSGAYEWQWDSGNSRLMSANKGVGSTTSETTMTITAPKACVFSFDWSVSSESNYDKLTVTLDGTTIVNGVSGSSSKSYEESIAAGTHSLVMKYSKDSSGDSGDDRAYVKNMCFTSNLVTEIKLDKTTATMLVGEKLTLTPTITPSGASNQNLSWTTSDKSVVSVNTSGEVTATGVGNATVTCTADDGSGVTATCTVTVISEQCIVVGDIDGDGKITIAEVNEMLNIYLGKCSARTMTLDDCLKALKFTGSVTQNGETKNYTNGSDNSGDTHEFVDLGLPSGTLWATCNVGANSPEEYGLYFAWGETTGYTSDGHSFGWASYKWCNGSYTTMTKYCTSSSYGTVDNKTELEAADDAATANWGSNWQMPSSTQISELINSSNTTTTWTTENGVYGRKITSKTNGNSIFLPAAGCRRGSSLSNVGSDAYYWSRSLYSSYSYCAYGLYFSSGNIYEGSYYRYSGFSVRPVRVSE